MRRTILLLATMALGLLLVGGVAASKQGLETTSSSTSPTTTTKSAGDVSIEALPTSKASFTSGSGATYLHIEVSDHGNLIAFESPQGQAHTGSQEGYTLCSSSGSTVHGYDASFGDEAGFGTPTFAQPNGAGTFPLTVTRNTTDGKFQLKQVWAKPDATEKDITVTMTLTNRSSSTINGVMIDRGGDFDVSTPSVGATGSSDQGAATRDSAFQWDDRFGGPDYQSPYGVQLTALTFATNHGASIIYWTDWNGTAAGRTTCSEAARQITPLAGDLAMRVLYVLGDLSAGQSKTVKYEYARM